MSIKLNEMQIDALKEIATIGAGNATTSISTMLNKKIEISVPETKLMEIEQVPEALGGAEQLVASVYFQLKGNFPASFMLIFEYKEALKMADKLLGRQIGSTKELDYFSESALRELGNISTGAYLSALAQFIKMKIDYDIPELAVDMLQAIIDGVLIKLALQTANLIVINAEFIVEKDTVKGHYLLLPEPKGLEFMLSELSI